MSSFYHIILYVIILALAFMVDYDYRHHAKVEVIRKKYRGYKTTSVTLPFVITILCIVYIFTEGMRYGRGIDQLNVYAPYYLTCNGHFLQRDYEPLFVLVNKFLNANDPLLDVIPFGSIFFVYAAAFIVGLLCIWCVFKDCSKYFLVFAILATLSFQEGFIRQAFSCSFIFIGIYFYERKQLKWAVLFLIASLLIHKGNMLIIGILVASKLIFRGKCISWKIAIPVFLVFEFVVQLDSVFNIIQSIVPFLHISDNSEFGDYLTNTDYIQYEMDTASEWKRGAFTEVLTAAFYVASFFLCSKLGTKYKKYSYLFNSYILCSLIFEPFRLYGTMSRAFIVGALLWPIPLSLAIYEWKNYKSKPFKLSVVIILLYIVTYYGRWIFMNPDAKYIWDL